jgi:hypothetical protein
MTATGNLPPMPELGANMDALHEAFRKVMEAENLNNKFRVFQEFVRQSYLVPSPPGHPFPASLVETGVLNPGDEIPLFVLTGENEETLLPIFTSKEKLSQFAEQQFESATINPWLVLSFLSNYDYVVINPGTDQIGIAASELVMFAGIPNNPGLLDAIAKLPSEPTRKRFYNAFLKSNLLMAFLEAPDEIAVDEEGRTVEGVPAKLLTATGPDGRGQVMVAFSDMESLLARNQDVVALTVVTAADIVQQVMASDDFDGVIVNPAGPWAGLSRKEVNAMYNFLSKKASAAGSDEIEA